MPCKCQTEKTLDAPNTVHPDEPCIFCAEKHISTAMRLEHESGYLKFNRQQIIGELVLAQWHLNKDQKDLAEDCRVIRHLVQNRRESEIGNKWELICEKLNPLVEDAIKKNTTKVPLIGSPKEIDTVYVISNVEYPEANKLKVNDNDLLIFLNTAKSIGYYADHVQKMCYHRKPEDAYGQPQRCPNLYVFNDSKERFVPTIPKPFIEELKKSYDWNYEIEKGKVKCATTGYIVVKWLQKLYKKQKIVLVNFGYEVKSSSYRCPYHNWKFEAEELKEFEHIFTAETINHDHDKIKVLYNLSGWMGDNVYASAVIENIMASNKFEINVGINNGYSVLWEKCPHLNREINESNADLILREHNYYGWDINTPHLVEGVTKRFSYDTNVDIPVVTKKPKFWIDLPEKRFFDFHYIILNTGWQGAAETKRWEKTYWEKLLTLLPDCKFVVSGEKKHHPYRLVGAVDMIDKTQNIVDFIHMVRDADCIVSPPSGCVHVSASFDVPCVCISGGREPASLTKYDNVIPLNSCGKLDCCKTKGCHLGHFEGDNSICKNFKTVSNIPVSECMLMITPEMVADEIRKILNKGM